MPLPLPPPPFPQDWHRQQRNADTAQRELLQAFRLEVGVQRVGWGGIGSQALHTTHAAHDPGMHHWPASFPLNHHSSSIKT